MIKNYFKIGWRNIVRHKAHAAINISGLAVGIAASLILFTIIKYELSYDKFQPNYKHIYHIATQRLYSEGIEYGEGVPFPAYDALRIAFPQATTASMYWNSNCQVTVLDPNDPNANSNKKFLEETGVFFSDPQFFSVFQYKWLTGSAQVLKEPNMAVITRGMAEKYFGKWQSAVGGLLKLDNTATVKVAGILENIPANTDFPLTVVGSYETIKRYPDVYRYSTDWGNVTSDFQSFMLLPPNVTSEAIDKQLITFCNEHYNKNRKDNDKTFNFLQPLSDIHFNNRIGTFGDHVTSKTTLWTLSLIGLFIIVMACINFINLFTARAV